MLTIELDNRIQESLLQIQNSSLTKGEMGVCIFYYVMGNHIIGDANQQIADKLLKKILDEIGENNKLDIETGVTGLALGISFLIKKKYVEGNVNTILEDIDAYIYKQLCLFLEGGAPVINGNVAIDILFYLIDRYKEIESKWNRILFEKCIIRLFNWIYINKPDYFYNEPLPFNLKSDIYVYLYLLVETYKLDIERERILHILGEMKYFLFSQNPILNANRLALSTLSSYIYSVTKDKDWYNYSMVLFSNVNVSYIVESEIQDKNIFPTRGVVAIWLLIKLFNKLNKEKIEVDNSYFKKRILESSFWDRLQYDKELLLKYYSLDGYCGVKLFLNYIDNEYEI